MGGSGRATQGLVGEADGIGFVPHDVCEKSNLCGRMGMGVGKDRGRRQEYTLGMLRGHAG